MNPAMRAHLDRTTKISALLRQFKEEVKAGEREFDLDTYPKGVHLRVVSYLESLGTADAVIEAEDLDAIEAAVNFLVENPDWKREKKAKSSPSADSDGDGGAAPAEKPKRKPGRPKKAAGGAAAAGAGGGAVLVLSDSEDEVPKKAKAKKAPGAPKKAPKPSALPPLPLSDSEDGISRIELFDQEFFWDQEGDGALYEVLAGGLRGEKVGTYDGHSATFG
jgi:hypothetical protein